MAQESEPQEPPADTCTLKLTLPDGATVAADGRDYGAKRELKWSGLTAGQIYRSKTEVRFPSGERETFQVFVEGGRRAELALAGPATGRPELMLQTGDTEGQVAWSPDGRYVMAGRILCDPITGRHLRSFPRPRSNMLCVAISPGDQRVAMGATSNAFAPTVGDYENVYIWDATSGRQVKTLPGPEWGTTCLAFSRDGRYLAAGGKASRRDPATRKYTFFGHVFVYDVSAGRRLRTLELPSDTTSLAFTPDGRHIAASSKPLARALGPDLKRPFADVGLWEVSTGRRVRNFRGHRDSVLCVDISRDGQHLLTSSVDKTIKIWELATGRLLQTLCADTSNVEHVLISADGRFAVTTSDVYEDFSSINIWDLSTRTLARRLHIQDDTIRSIALSADGQRLLAGSGDYDSDTGESRGQVFLWDLASGQLLKSRSLENQVEAVAITPDGKAGFVITDDGEPFLWDLATGEPTKAYGGDNAAVFSPDGKYLLTGDYDGATLWDVAAGEEVRELGGDESVEAVAFSKDGKHLFFATSKDGDPVRMFDVQSGELIRTFSGHKGDITHVSVSADGRRLLARSGYPDERVLLWDLETGNSVWTCGAEYQGQGPTSAVLAPDGRSVIVGSDSQCFVLDAADGDRVGTLRGHTGWIAAARFTPDGRHVVAANWDYLGKAGSEEERRVSHAIVWDVSSDRQMQCLPEVDGIVHSLAVSPDGRRVLVDDEAKTIFDLATGTTECTLQHDSGSVHLAGFRSDGLLAEYSRWGGHTLQNMSIRSVTDGQTLSSLETGHTDAVFARAFSRDGRYLVTGSWDKTAALWDVKTGRKVHVLQHAAKLNAVAISRDNALIATGAGSYQEPAEARVWDAATGRVLYRLEGHTKEVQTVVFSPDGQQLVTGSTRIVKAGQNADGTDRYDSFGEVFLWDMNTGRRLHRFPEDEVLGYQAAFTPDGRMLALIGTNEQITLYDVSSHRKLRAFGGKETVAQYGITFSPNGKLLVAVPWAMTTDPHVYIYDVTAGRMIREIRGGHQSRVDAAEFSPDGSVLMTTSLDGSAILWDVATGKELARLMSADQAKEWIALTPEGFFDGSPGARKSITFRVGGGLNVVPVDRFFQDFYRPGLLAELLRGERPLPKSGFAAKMAPLVRITAPSGDVPVESSKVTIDVEVTDRGGGIKGPWLLQNGARVLAPGRPVAEGKMIRRSFSVALVEGENRFEVFAASADGSWESEPAVIALKYAQPLDKSAVHLLAVGINQYAEQTMNLRFAAPDAQAMAKLFAERGDQLYGEGNVHITTLVDAQATTEGIKKALKEIAAKAKPQDTLAVFLAGHGTVVGQRYYFIPHEYRSKSGKLEDDIRQQGLAGDVLGDWLAAAPALKRVMIYDTCQSGGAIRIQRTARNPFAFRGALERLSRTQGVFTIAATAATDNAQEVPELGHGVLTYALLAGLGAVDGGPLKRQAVEPKSGQVVDVRDWFSFAQDKVPLLTTLLFGHEQFVAFSGQGQSFPVLPLKDK